MSNYERQNHVLLTLLSEPATLSINQLGKGSELLSCIKLNEPNFSSVNVIKIHKFYK